MPRTTIKLALLTLVGLAAVVLLSPAAPARAAGFLVDSTADATDALPGDGQCATPAGECTLRAAVQETNALPGPNTIALPAGTYAFSLSGEEDAAASGDLDITDDLTIIGSGAEETIVGGGVVGRVLHVDPTLAGVSVDVRDMTICCGGYPALGGGFAGAMLIEQPGTLALTRTVVRNHGARDYPGILNRGQLTITDSTITKINGSSSLPGVGAAVSNDGTLEVRNSVISATTFSGAIESSGMLTVAGSTLTGNHGLIAGGIENSGTAVVVDTTIADNDGDAIGGIANRGSLSVSGTAIGGNSTIGFVSYSAGGISNYGLDPEDDPQLEVTNSSVYQNSFGGVRNDGTANLTNVTMQANGVDIQNEGTVALTNTVLAASISCGGSVPVTSGGHNIDRDGSCALAGPGDLSGVDPLVGAPGDYGGPTYSIPLLAGSPAIDAGDDAACPPADQRGAPRPVDGDGDGDARCDMGAYESGGAPPSPTPTPTPTPCDDTDGDTLCRSIDIDDDNDGCLDKRELGDTPSSGGLRDPDYFWDFMDQYTGSPFVRDRVIAVGDIGAVVIRFGTSGDPNGNPLVVPLDMTGYHTSADRNGIIPGGDLWDLLPPDGNIAVGDIGAVVGQFGHSCA